MRGTFANIRLKNLAAEGTTGGFARHVPSGEVAPLYDVAMRYADEGTPLVIVGGKEYGTAVPYSLPPTITNGVPSSA